MRVFSATLLPLSIIYGFINWEYVAILLIIHFRLNRDIKKWNKAEIENMPYRFFVFLRKRNLATAKGFVEAWEAPWSLLRLFLIPPLFFLPIVFLLPFLSLLLGDPSLTETTFVAAHLVIVITFPGLAIPHLLREIYRTISGRLEELELSQAKES